MAGEKLKPRKLSSTDLNSDEVSYAPGSIDEPSGVKSPGDIIRDILSPKMSLAPTDAPYQVPVAVRMGEVDALQDLDERKLIELKEVRHILIIVPT